ncbi:hypothetical protein CDL15_Pgr010477 [Punica granatum]|uniref:Uncharacterized protein n=1 Tax=Punica granatum TaxID=22663 RepID=A0A218XXF0_PUNGR|nr:hypothetical protein CDL15_Pgr010477 [Punica granatum]
MSPHPPPPQLYLLLLLHHPLFRPPKFLTIPSDERQFLPSEAQSFRISGHNGEYLIWNYNFSTNKALDVEIPRQKEHRIMKGSK